MFITYKSVVDKTNIDWCGAEPGRAVMGSGWPREGSGEERQRGDATNAAFIPTAVEPQHASVTRVPRAPFSYRWMYSVILGILIPV